MCGKKIENADLIPPIVLERLDRGLPRNGQIVLERLLVLGLVRKDLNFVDALPDGTVIRVLCDVMDLKTGIAGSKNMRRNFARGAC